MNNLLLALTLCISGVNLLFSHGKPEPEIQTTYFVSFSHKSGFGNNIIDIRPGGIGSGKDIRDIERFLKAKCPPGFDTASVVLLYVQKLPM